MTNMTAENKIRIEAITEILSDFGVVATQEQIASITDAFYNHVELESEINSHRYAGHKEECSNCKQLQAKLDEAKKEINVHEKSVMRRRKASKVWIEGDSVMYDK